MPEIRYDVSITTRKTHTETWEHAVGLYCPNCGRRALYWQPFHLDGAGADSLEFTHLCVECGTRLELDIQTTSTAQNEYRLAALQEQTPVIGPESRLTDAEFRALLDLLMCSDPWPIADEQGGDHAHKTLIGLADWEARARGYDGGWVVAYHELGNPVPQPAAPTAFAAPTATPRYVKVPLEPPDNIPGLVVSDGLVKHVEFDEVLFDLCRKDDYRGLYRELVRRAAEQVAENWPEQLDTTGDSR